MSSKSSQNDLSKNDYKSVLAEPSSIAKPYSETVNLYQEKRLLPRPVWFKRIARSGSF